MVQSDVSPDRSPHDVAPKYARRFTFLRSVTLLPMALHSPTLFRRVGVLGLSRP